MKQKGTIIIAEAGVNHNGDITLAKKLVIAAAGAGADFVKFQTFKAGQLVAMDTKLAPYQQRNTGGKILSQFEMLKALELSERDHKILKELCAKSGIGFLSTAFDHESLKFLKTLKPEYYKIPSGEITNLPLLRSIGSLKKKVILSTGMSHMHEVKEALNVIRDAGTLKKDITILHCSSEYPAPAEDVNLLAMCTMRDKLGVKVGYSDHTMGIEIPVAAVALGACIIEKHFTLSRSLNGPDHKASLEPEELKAMVAAIRNVESALGNGIKKPSKQEKVNLSVARKSIHTARLLKKGHIIKPADLIMLRPGDGISPMRLDEVVGKKVKRDVPAGRKLNNSEID